MAAVCDECGSPATKKCGRCQDAAFCSKLCQHKAWPKHKPGCDAKCQAKLAELAKNEVELFRLKAEQHLRAGQRELAVDCVSTCLMLDPDQRNVWGALMRLIGNEYMKTHHLEDAFNTYSLALFMDATNAEAWSNRSRVLLALGQPFFAFSDALQCHGLRPAWYKANLRIGLALEVLACPRSALANFISARIKADDEKHEEIDGIIERVETKFDVTMEETQVLMLPRDPRLTTNQLSKLKQLLNDEIGCVDEGQVRIAYSSPKTHDEADVAAFLESGAESKFPVWFPHAHQPVLSSWFCATAVVKQRPGFAFECEFFLFDLQMANEACF